MGSTRPPPAPPVVLSTPEDDSELTMSLNHVARLAAQRKPYLLFLAGNEVGRSVELSSELVTLGRGSSCTVRVDEEQASRLHARLTKRGDSWFVEDAGSANGTLVNGKKIRAATKLENGDKIQIGTSTVVKFALLDPLEEQYERRIRGE